MPRVKGKITGEHTAIHRFVRISPRKCRLVIDMIRGLPVDQAIELAKRDPHRGSYFVHKLLVSAAAGALEKEMPGDLIVSTARVDEGPTIKRFRPRAQGRATSIFKRTSHIIVGLKSDREE
ncbi:MAG: 50S ribosomal protein L22 [Planctomycetes bacterium]|nr:50S ribosomal protein L22 [Planctomycetota bacterium]